MGESSPLTCWPRCLWYTPGNSWLCELQVHLRQPVQDLAGARPEEDALQGSLGAEGAAAGRALRRWPWCWRDRAGLARERRPRGKHNRTRSSSSSRELETCLPYHTQNASIMTDSIDSSFNSNRIDGQGILLEDVKLGSKPNFQCAFSS